LLGSAENQNIALFPSSGKVFMASELLSSFGGVLTMKAVAL
jgi:hypothetical protein